MCGLRVYGGGPTNVATCELARRCLLSTLLTKDINPNTDTTFRPAALLLVGHSSRLNVVDSLSQIHLDLRIERITSALFFIKDNKSDLITLLKGNSGTDSDDTVSVLATHEKFTEIVKAFLALLHVLIDEAPQCIIKSLSSLVSLKFINGMKKAQFVTAVEFQGFVKQSSTAGSLDAGKTNSRVATLFSYLICKLQGSYVNVKLVERKDLERLIFEEASVVFSTVIVTGRTLFRNADFDVAVVDEAT